MFITILLVLSSTTVYASEPGMSDFPKPVDSESWTLPREMTWNEYRPVPGIDWRDTDFEPERVIKGAVILVDFPDQEFILTQPKGSDPAGNPISVGGIPREELGEFFVNYLNTPQPLNNYRTIDEYWRENSFGKWGIELDAFGPYRMDHNEFQYGLNEFGQTVNMPPGYTAKNFGPEAIRKAQADIEASGEDYDFSFIIHAGYDESGVWAKFGEMMFESPETIPDEFGPPFENMPNSAVTRVVPWTSWLAAKSLWARASIGGKYAILGENSGMGTFAHELGHIQELLDNYNDPYGDPVSRAYSGPWEVMANGANNGPGGPHERWRIPASLGATSPSHHMLRNKIKQGFLSKDQYMSLDRDELAETGPVFTDIVARAVPTGEKFGRTGINGINITMEDLTPRNYLEDDWRADMQRGENWYNNYTLEVVDQVGFDSFNSDSGVLIAKTRDDETWPNIWVIDSHPEDINLENYKKADGTIKMFSKGDQEQLADALFKSGTAPGVVSEYKDEHNRLHFYVLGKSYDDDGALSYRVAVRHMDGSGPHERGVNVTTKGVSPAIPGRVAHYNFSVTNTGEETDIIRLNAATEAGWELMLENSVIEVEAGKSVDVPVYVKIPKDAKAPTNLTLTVTSETDREQTATEVNKLLNDVNVSGMKALVEGFEKEGAFANYGAARSLEAHLNSVSHFEKLGKTEKAFEHMNGFTQLLNHQKDKKLISEKAYNILKSYADTLVERL
ncbi:FixG Ig-like domain-containing protein [Bacillus sp. JJ1503]|uniref:FIMAH domain-containing protein n=1 Tax=unclassified Bacillus (in: firmicutes) TaxID=185979 RepID=UPI002FFEC56C